MIFFPDYDKYTSNVYNITVNKNDLPSFTGRSIEEIEEAIDLGFIKDADVSQALDASIWSERVRHIDFLKTNPTDSLSIEFSEKGFCQYDGRMNERDIENVLDIALELEKKYRNPYSDTNGMNINYIKDNNKNYVIERFNDIFLIDSLWNIVKDLDFVHEIASRIHRNRYCIANVKILFRRPGAIGFLPHRDPLFVDRQYRRTSALAIAINLVDTSEADGGLVTSSTSHREISLKSVEACEIHGYTPSDTHKGSILGFNPGVMHKCADNTGTKVRYTLQFGIVNELESKFLSRLVSKIHVYNPIQF